MHGILGFMEDKTKIILFLIFVISHQYIIGDQIKNEFAMQTPSSDQEYNRNVLPTIILDSIVIDNRNGKISGLVGVKSLGNFLYEEKADVLANFIEKQVQSGSQIIPKDASNFRLVKIPGKDFMISDASFVVFFDEQTNKDIFNSDYNLTPQFIMPNAISYKHDSFESLGDLINEINKDDRVSYVELGLINPYIGPQ